MLPALQIIPTALLGQYLAAWPGGALAAFDALQDADLSTDDFSFYTSVASVFSSKIEGENIDLDSYVQHKRFGAPYQPDYTRKVDDLYEAYQYAQNHTLTPSTLAEAHKILSRHLLPTSQQGRLRNQHMYITTADGRIEYVATAPTEVATQMQLFFADLEALIAEPLAIPEAFFFASMLHLVFVKIHPYADGNGRTARLLEKWFLAAMLGPKAWFLPAERYYYEQHSTYYANLRALGLEDQSLDYGKALPFLVMLPAGLK